ncbi:MAG: formylglycine-generating enzyme family protein [Pedobacter sp.]|jgi:formylglycine-generating enzyme required for sulfatase activity
MRYLLIILILTAFFSASYAQKEAVNSEKKMLPIPKGMYEPFFITKSNKPIPVAAFKMDETAVTNTEFLEFVKANPEWRKSKVNRLFADANYLRHWESDLSIGKSNQNIYNSPVVNVSWFAARAYCQWKNKRLPTVAEWEFAGMGTPKNIKYSSLTDYILDWYKRPNLPVLPNIKTTYQNIYGLYDMHGLIWEWTFNFNSYITSSDSRGNNSDDQKLFCAAGSLNVVDKTDYAGYLRFSYRGSLKGNYCIANLGFRCAKNII